jgi:hypothetical protein
MGLMAHNVHMKPWIRRIRMTITGVSNTPSYVPGNLQTPVTSASSLTASTAGIDTVSLSTDTIDFAIGGVTANQQASNADSLFSTLNANILDYPNLSGVGSAITKYTDSLASSNVYESSYTAPSAKYLADLSALKTAAASGNQQKSESLLAKAKLDGPDNVAGGISTAISRGDTAGEAVLVAEGTNNMSDFLATQGYSSTGATTEAAAITINGFSLGAANTTTSTPQSRLQQISDLAEYAADNQATSQAGTATTTSDPLLNMITTLIEANGIGPNGIRSVESGFATSGAAIDQSLTNLITLYGLGTSSATSSNA